jgi:predicted Zn-dependent protease
MMRPLPAVLQQELDTLNRAAFAELDDGAFETQEDPVKDYVLARASSGLKKALEEHRQVREEAARNGEVI